MGAHAREVCTASDDQQTARRDPQAQGTRLLFAQLTKRRVVDNQRIEQVISDEITRQVFGGDDRRMGAVGLRAGAEIARAAALLPLSIGRQRRVGWLSRRARAELERL